MDLRKTLGVLAVFLLVLGFGGAAMALTPVDTKDSGVYIRIDEPATGVKAKIGDTIRVTVTTYKEAYDTMYVALTIDTSATVGEVETFMSATSAGVVKKLASGGTGTLLAAVCLTSPPDSSGGSYIWRLKIAVVAGDTTVSAASSLGATAIFKKNSATVNRRLKNHQTGDQIDTGSDALSTTPVGDGVVIGIDGQRPVSTGVINSLAATAAGPFKSGDQLGFTLDINLSTFLSAGAAEARIAFVHPDSPLASDDFLTNGKAITSTALAKSVHSGGKWITITKSDLLTNNVQSDSVVVGTGVSFTDNERFLLGAVVADDAGNLSASSASAATAEGFTSSTTLIADSTLPTKTLYYCVDQANVELATGALLSGKKAQAVSVRSITTGAFATVNYDSLLQPFKLVVSETADSVAIEFGDSVLIFASGVFTEDDTISVDLSTLAKVTASGETDDLKVTVQDSVGNIVVCTVTGVTIDRTAPTISDLFPTASNAPKDDSDVPTLTDATVDPKFRSDEKLRRADLRYIATGETDPEEILQGYTAGNPQLDKVDTDIIVDFSATFGDKQYTLDGIVFDLAGNVTIFGPDSLTFDADFNNPQADTFTVTAALDTAIAGQGNLVTITAGDATQTGVPPAVTYASGDVTISAEPAAAAAAKTTGSAGHYAPVSFSGNDNVTDNGDGTASVASDAWLVGQMTVVISSTSDLDLFSIIVEETSTSGDSTVVNLSGRKDFTVDAAELSAYKVVAMEEGTETAEVSGDFQVWVQGTDKWGNPSMKARTATKSGATTYALTDSTGLTDARIDEDNVLPEVFVVLAANNGAARVPQGPQALGGAGATFTATAPDATGEGLWIGVKTFNSNSESSGIDSQQNKVNDAKGSTTVSFVPFGETPDVGPVGAPEAPGGVIGQDYLGGDGEGDQGQMILVSWMDSPTAGVTSYVIDRQLSVTTGIVDGALVELDEAVDQWVVWAQVNAIPAAEGDDGVNRAVVPVPGGGSSVWGVRAIKGGEASGRTGTLAKRVFTKESIQQVVELLGLDANGVLSREELLKQFNAPKDYVQSILGDQKNIVFASLNPDVSALLGTNANVPSSIRTAGGVGDASARAITDGPVAPVDNIEPAAATDAEGARVTDGVDVSWTVSADDGVVGTVQYRGYSLPIAGVEKYQILRGASEDDLAAIATVGKGQTSFEDRDLPEGVATLIYRVDALDLDNSASGTSFPVAISLDRVQEVAEDGLPIYRLVLDGTPEVDFEDFVAFAQSYDSAPGQAGFNPQADTNDDGIVNFTDFVAFAQRYGLTAVVPAGKRVVVPLQPGANSNTEMSLNLTSDRVLVGHLINVTISAANAEALFGYGLVVSYDTDKFEFVDAKPAENDLMKSAGGETPLFRHWTESGQVTIANAVINSEAVSGDGELVTLTFKVLREFEENARFEISQGVLFDPEQLSNPAVILGVLSVESTPTEFALQQNFPNPFNPETTIKYQLAEGANVQLRIYNIVGQVVRTLVSESQSAGRYQVRWAGTDDRGAAVSSGIYFYQVSAGKFQDVKRLMLLK